jgi:hypothetical protein
MDDIKKVELKPVQLEGEKYFKITNNDSLRPFFMSIVSHSNHWMFISSNGGLSAGRKDAEYALFPYYTDDKITESSEITGSKSIFIVHQDEGKTIWEPFSERYEGMYKVSRNLYKNIYGNKIVFEEVNHDLQLTFRYQWNSSETFGFVRKSKLINDGDSQVQISALDGIQNIVPYGVGSAVQNQSSNLVDAYKRSELLEDSGLGIYALSAIIVDKAEPSEALKANVVWSIGINNPKYLLSSLQLKDFRKGKKIHQEKDVKAEKGAYFIHAELTLDPNTEMQWMIIANVNQTHSDIVKLSESIKNEEELEVLVNQDIKQGTKQLIELNASSDGIQLTADQYRDTRHFSNTLFNIMRGGIFDYNYQIEKWDFSTYVQKANNHCFSLNKNWIEKLSSIFTLTDLKEVAMESGNPDFMRLCLEYLPLKFSRRHGDPSRPWNRFSINTRSEVDGSKILDYEGNWRDIFQNWEALGHSFPEFVESMIHKFLNASTFDGYNPYRITKDGFDWETIEPDDPWSYIGYWGDHQIIYLQKLLEVLENHNPGVLEGLFNREIFVYANVPYRIKSYEDLLRNPKDTIAFDEESDNAIRERRMHLGADGALLQNAKGDIYKVNFIEKILVTLLAKISNFIPEGGIWMNTQRPEWNDANNALVGNGVSMVTLYYLRRFLTFFEAIFDATTIEKVSISSELLEFFNRISDTLDAHQKILSSQVNDSERKLVLDGVGKAGSDFRNLVYNKSFSGLKKPVSTGQLAQFAKLSLKYLDHSIKANRRTDDLYHAYNLMTIENDHEVSISHLSEMLEGQVAVLSSGFLTSREALDVLDGLKNSSLFRDDQYSYLLYPNKQLPQFSEKNNIPKKSVVSSELLTSLVKDGNTQIINQDVRGNYHFNGNFRNASDLKQVLNVLSDSKYSALVNKEEKQVLQIFEDVFNHKAFTGRSGTFFGYEGLGSIYWHMVSKLLLATQECCLKAFKEKESEEVIGRLLEHYYEINEGIGVHKPPSLYGAFPTDPYSHTPAGKGAQQPGMTGQVKEDILCRFGELGVFVENGKLCFNPCLLRLTEFIKEPMTFNYIDVNQEKKHCSLSKGSLAFTYCQVPILYHLAEKSGIEVRDREGNISKRDSLILDSEISSKVFGRTGHVMQIDVFIKRDSLR